MVCLPPSFDPNKKYPLIVYYYGGTTPTTRGITSPYCAQLFASRDYVVYVIQPSGAIGYGQEFSARHVNVWGERTADEIIEGTKKFCAAHPFVNDKRIGCIGCGNMGGAILGGLAEVPGLELYGYNRTPQRLEPLCAKGITAVPDIPGIAARCDILVIGVKPYLVGGVLAEALPSLKPETVVISIAAGVTLHDLRDAVQGRCHVVRVMPNTPALVGAGVFGIQEDPALPKDVFAMILDLFGLLGSTIVLPEKKFNAFMALVGCGPAYVFHFMDALAEAGVTMGFTRQEALELVTQLVLAPPSWRHCRGAIPPSCANRCAHRRA